MRRMHATCTNHTRSIWLSPLIREMGSNFNGSKSHVQPKGQAGLTFFAPNVNLLAITQKLLLQT